MQGFFNPLQYIDRWLPERLRGIVDPWNALQARALLALLLLLIIPLVFLTLTLVVISSSGIAELWWYVGLVLFTVLCGAGCLFYFQKTGNLRLSSMLYGVLIFWTVMAAIFVTGGWMSPACLYLLALPVFVGLVADRKTSIFFSVLILFSYSFLFALYKSSYTFSGLETKNYLSYIQLGLWVLTLGSIFLGFLLYDFSEQGLTAAVAREREKLDQEAHRDYQTQLLNEQGLYELIQQRDSNSNNSVFGRGLVLVLVNNLPEIVSHFGYEVGDLFLEKVVGNLKEFLSAQDALIRYSEQEFVIYTDYGAGAESSFSRILNKINDSKGEAIVLKNDYRFLLDIDVMGLEIKGSDLSVPDMLEKVREDLLLVV